MRKLVLLFLFLNLSQPIWAGGSDGCGPALRSDLNLALSELLSHHGVQTYPGASLNEMIRTYCNIGGDVYLPNIHAELMAIGCGCDVTRGSSSYECVFDADELGF